MWRTGSKNGLFFGKSLYKALEQRTFSSFPGSAFEDLCIAKNQFLCKGGF